MKSLSFNEMEVDPINFRLMNIGNGDRLSANITNVYLVAPLSEDEIKYYTDEDTAEFFGYDINTPLNGIWLLNGTIDDNGHFAVAEREDIYRYTSLDAVQLKAIANQETVGTYTTDAWGSFITGYTPIYTTEGNFVGLLGIDMNPDAYQASAKTMIVFMILEFAVTAIIMVGIFLIFYFKYTKIKEGQLSFEFYSRMSHDMRTPMNAILGMAELSKDETNLATADIPFGTVNQATVADASGFSEIRTLVVDDDKESCEYSGILLERLGVRFDYVTSGEEALDTLGEAEDKGDPYKLCLIDWKISDMDGIQVTQKIREIFGEDTIVIIVSAYDLNELENTGKAAGANYFIPKPLFQSTLFNALMKISGGDYAKIDAEEEKKTFDFTGKRVLVAEDVALNMEVAIKLLQMVGIETVCAEDGRQAVDLFKKADPGTYDCILMDINMPIMDGYEAAKAIRSMPRTDAPYIPIYAMTANAFSEDVTAALNAGMNGHIAKPIETRVLYKTLETAFSMNEK